MKNCGCVEDGENQGSVDVTSQAEKELCGGGAVLEGQAKEEETKGHCWCVTERCCAMVLWGETGEFLRSSQLCLCHCFCWLGQWWLPSSCPKCEPGWEEAMKGQRRRKQREGLKLTGQ